jgi:hypothetical protein
MAYHAEGLLVPHEAQELDVRAGFQNLLQEGSVTC